MANNNNDYQGKDYYIPMNFIKPILKKIRNFIEIIVMLFIEYCVIKKIIPFKDSIATMIMLGVASITIVILFIGVHNESTGQYLYQMIRFFLNRKNYKIRRIGQDGYGRTEEVVKRTKECQEKLKEREKQQVIFDKKLAAFRKKQERKRRKEAKQKYKANKKRK